MPTKVCLVKAMVFPVVMDGCESQTVKKAGWKVMILAIKHTHVGWGEEVLLRWHQW